MQANIKEKLVYPIIHVIKKVIERPSVDLAL